MPVIQVHLIEGRTEGQKSQLIKAVTDAVVESLNAPKESVRIIIHEVPNTNFGIAGETAKHRGR
jgi:4-oxalocrotonate tautomerase